MGQPTYMYVAICHYIAFQLMLVVFTHVKCKSVVYIPFSLQVNYGYSMPLPVSVIRPEIGAANATYRFVR